MTRSPTLAYARARERERVPFLVAFTEPLTMHKQQRLFAYVLRFLAAAILILAVLAVALPPAMWSQDAWRLLWVGFVLAIASAVALLALASLVVREASAPPEVRSSLSRLQQQLMDLSRKIDDANLMYERSARGGTTPQPLSIGSGQFPAARDYSDQFQKLTAAIAEVRELSLLPDSDRRMRVQAHREQRKATSLKELFGMVAAHEWTRAERLLINLEAEFPNDDEVAKGRSYLNHSRTLFEEDTVRHARTEIDELIASGSLDRAWERAQHLVQGFPHSGEVRAIHGRVEKERATHMETAAQRMFDEIRANIDQRIWRPALQHAQRLIELYPEHRLAERVREQLKTLQDNAEIEERQELEVRIQENIRAERFDDAIDLAEDLIRRYPLSPQADSLETLLPRLRELSRQHGGGSISPASEFDEIVTDDAEPFGDDIVIPHDEPSESGQR